MSKHFRPWKIDQPQLLPADVAEYVPKGHLARFIVALVRESLDLKRSRRRIRARSASIRG